MPPILIDTNVLLYLYDHNQPVKQEQAQKVLTVLLGRRPGTVDGILTGEGSLPDIPETVAQANSGPGSTANQSLYPALAGVRTDFDDRA